MKENNKRESTTNEGKWRKVIRNATKLNILSFCIKISIQIYMFLFLRFMAISFGWSAFYIDASFVNYDIISHTVSLSFVPSQRCIPSFAHLFWPSVFIIRATHSFVLQINPIFNMLLMVDPVDYKYFPIFGNMDLVEWTKLVRNYTKSYTRMCCGVCFQIFGNMDLVEWAKLVRN